MRRQLPGKPGSEMPEYRPYTHQEYVSGATPETVDADFRSGVWRIARRAGAAVLAGAAVYGLFNSGSAPENGSNPNPTTPPAVVHEVGQPTAFPDVTSSQQELITSVSVVDLQG